MTRSTRLAPPHRPSVATISSRTPGPRSATPIVARAGRFAGSKNACHARFVHRQLHEARGGLGAFDVGHGFLRPNVAPSWPSIGGRGARAALILDTGPRPGVLDPGDADDAAAPPRRDTHAAHARRVLTHRATAPAGRILGSGCWAISRDAASGGEGEMKPRRCAPEAPDGRIATGDTRKRPPRREAGPSRTLAAGKPGAASTPVAILILNSRAPTTGGSALARAPGAPPTAAVERRRRPHACRGPRRHGRSLRSQPWRHPTDAARCLA